MSLKNRPFGRMSVESLESRDVMSYGVNLNAVTGLVTVGGTSAADMFRIDPVPGSSAQVSISFSSVAGDQQVKLLPADTVKAVRIEGNGGDDYLVNLTSIPTTTVTKNGGTVNSSLMAGSPKNAAAGQTGNVGVFTAGTTGVVSVDYLYRGAGYSGELGFYSLAGMDAYKPGSVDYKREAARRALSGSSLGGIGVSAQSQGARFTGNMPWEGNLNRGTYTGQRTITFAAGERFAAILVPSGTLKDVFNNPAIGGATTPLFSIPEANPYAVTPQLRGQVGDIDGQGSLFAFEDQRLDGASDRDYNDLVFQVTGARGVATPVSDVLNTGRNMFATTVGKNLLGYATSQRQADAATALSVAGVAGGSQAADGVFTVGETGKVSVDFRYDGGGYAGQLGMFSLEGMGGLKPGSVEFKREALRRAMSESTLGRLVIDDINTDSASITGTTWWDGNFNRGAYRGPRSVLMTPGDRVAFVLVPNSSLWWTMANASTTGINAPLFSIAAANPGESTQITDWTEEGTVFGFEDRKADGSEWCDRDYNDIVFRLSGFAGTALSPDGLIEASKDMRKQAFAKSVFVGV
jgi:hypothetical protein